MSRSETNLIFFTIDTDNNGFLSFCEFYDYFVKCVLGDAQPSKCEAQMRAAFLDADKKGSGRINFREFADFAWSHRRSVTLSRLFKAFEKMDVDESGEICYKKFKNFFNAEATRSSLIQLGRLESETASDGQAVEELMKGFYDHTDIKQVGGSIMLYLGRCTIRQYVLM